MGSFIRSFPKRYDDHPPLEAPIATPTFARQLPSRPARVLFGDGDFVLQRRKLGAGGRRYAAHSLGGGEWTLFEIPSGREFLVHLERPPKQAAFLETWFESTETGWVARMR